MLSQTLFQGTVLKNSSKILRLQTFWKNLKIHSHHACSSMIIDKPLFYSHQHYLFLVLFHIDATSSHRHQHRSLSLLLTWSSSIIFLYLFSNKKKLPTHRTHIGYKIRKRRGRLIDCVIKETILHSFHLLFLATTPVIDDDDQRPRYKE